MGMSTFQREKVNAMRDIIFDNMNPLPQDFERFIKTKGFKNHSYIFYERVKKHTPKGKRAKIKCYCTYCEKEFIANSPIEHGQLHNETGRKCPHCHTDVTYKHVNKYGRAVMDEFNVAHAQYIFTKGTVHGGILFRVFNVHRHFYKDFIQPKIVREEMYRIFINELPIIRGRQQRYTYIMYYDRYSNYGNWHASEQCTARYESYLYTKNLKSIIKNTRWKYTGIYEMAKRHERPVLWDEYLNQALRLFGIEKLAKVGCTNITAEFIHYIDVNGYGNRYKTYYDDSYFVKNRRETLKEILPDFTAQERQYIAQQNLWHDEAGLYSEIIRRKTAKRPSIAEMHELIMFLRRLGTKYPYNFNRTVLKILKHINIKQFTQYLKKSSIAQNEKSGQWLLHFLTMWRDTLQMLQTTGVNMRNKQLLMPNNLRALHDDTMEKIKVIEDTEMNKRIKQVADANKFLKFSKGDYFTTLPQSCEDFKKEGNKLNHCVGRAGYIKNVSKGESIIIFIRKVSAPYAPYYTMELNDEYELIQCRTKNNKSYEDSKEMKKFVKEFLAYVYAEPRNAYQNIEIENVQAVLLPAI